MNLNCNQSSRLRHCAAAFGILMSGALAGQVFARPDEGPWTQEKSPQPSKREWSEASPFEIPRLHGERAKKCEGSRVREWLKVRCRGVPTAAIQLVGGQARNVYYWIEPASEKDDQMPGDGEVVLAVRKGDLRVIQWWTFGPGYDGPLTVLGSVMLQQKWPEGANEPSFVLSDVLQEPIRTATQEGK